MRRAIQLLALLIAAGTLVVWLGTGAHTGWTQTSVRQVNVDEITGLEEIRYEDRFVMGLEMLTGGLAGAVVLAGVSFLFKKPTFVGSTTTQAQQIHP